MSEKSKNKLTRKQNLIRHGLPILAAIVATGGIADHIAEASNNNAPPKAATVLLGKLVIEAGTNLHTSPSQDIDLDVGPDASNNIAEQVPEGHTITVVSPRVETITDGLGNQTVWLGFEDISAGNAWRWIASSTIAQQESSSNTSYVSMSPDQDKSYGSDNLADPDTSDEATAQYNQTTGQYELNNKPVAVGLELPSQDSAIVS